MRRRAWRGAAALALLSALSPGSIARADQVPRALAQKYGELAARAEAAIGQAGPAAGIRLYEEGLLNLGEDYGRVHLRLAQLYQQLGQSVDAAQHFKACGADARVEAIDRDLICGDGLKAVTSPVGVQNLPEGGRVLVVSPAAFAGPLKSGDRLPLGTAQVLIEAPSHDRREVSLRVVAPATVLQVDLEPAVTDVEDAGPEPSSGGVRGDTEPAPEQGGHWPAIATGATGLVLVAAGLTLGFLNRGTLDTIREKQAAGRCGPGSCKSDLSTARSHGKIADALWIGGAGVTGVGVGLWFALD